MYIDQVFFDIEIGGKPAGRVVMGLFGKVICTILADTMGSV
jgi:hypothetical protein